MTTGENKPLLRMGKYWWIPALVSFQSALSWVARWADEPSNKCIDLFLAVPLTIGAIVLIVMALSGERELRKEMSHD